MSRFRKRPVEIDAVQLTWATWSEVCDLIGNPFPEGTRGVYVKPDGTYKDSPVSDWHDDHQKIGLVLSPQATHYADNLLAVEGDWVIRGTEGELYPCKDSVFQANYEPA